MTTKNTFTKIDSNHLSGICGGFGQLPVGSFQATTMPLPSANGTKIPGSFKPLDIPATASSFGSPQR